jgi:serine phosphatase RsbU (regulator of sigma subunit)
LQTLQEQLDQQIQLEQEQANQEQKLQNSPQGQLLNSIAQKIGGNSGQIRV